LSAIILPSGSFFGIPVKYIAFISCVSTLFAEWKRGAKINKNILVLFVLVCIFIMFFMLVGTLRTVTTFNFILSEGMMFFSTISVTLIILAARSISAVKDENIILYIFWGVFVYVFWKATVSMLVAMGILSLDIVFLYFVKYINYRPVVTEMPGGGVRFTFIIYDYISAVFLFLVPAFPKVFSKIPMLIRIMFMVFGTASVVFAYSRYLFALIGVFWVYAFLFKFNFKQRIIASAIVAVVMLLSLTWITDVFQTRFLSEQAEYSDSFRYLQIDSLLQAWEEVPVLGGGLGYYAKGMIRSLELPYTYEVQWVSFFAKFGMLGISFLIFLVILLFYAILSGKRQADHYLLAFVLLTFIMAGFTNQYLLNAASGVFYSLPLIFSAVLREKITPQK
jgi:hypothetical protein